MRITKRYAVIALALLMLTGCGKVEEKRETAAPVEKIDEVTEESCTSEYPTDDETTAEETTSEETIDIDDYDFDQYYNYIIGDGAFGFEMYNNGHIRQSWDNRLEGARIILKGMAMPGTEEKMLELAVTSEQLNALETEGFMSHMKFEDKKSFRVGDTKINGEGVTLIGYENSFIFNINYFDENDEYKETAYYEFPIDLIPDLVEAVQYGNGSESNGPDAVGGQEITGGTSSNTLISEGYVWNEENKTGFMGMYQGNYLTAGFDTPKTLEILFEALTDEKVTSTKTEKTSDDNNLNLDKGLELQIVFFDIYTGKDPEYKTINVGRETINCISLYIFGTDNSYKIRCYEKTGKNLSDESSFEMTLSKEYAERLINEVFGI